MCVCVCVWVGDGVMIGRGGAKKARRDGDCRYVVQTSCKRKEKTAHVSSARGIAGVNRKTQTT